MRTALIRGAELVRAWAKRRISALEALPPRDGIQRAPYYRADMTKPMPPGVVGPRTWCCHLGHRTPELAAAHATRLKSQGQRWSK